MTMYQLPKDKDSCLVTVLVQSQMSCLILQSIITYSRYITIMTPVVANRSPSAVIDELHFKCLLSAGRQGKVLYEEKLKHQYPSLSVENVKSPPPSASSPAPNSTKKASFFDQFSENTLWFHRFGSISMDHIVTPVPSNGKIRISNTTT